MSVIVRSSFALLCTALFFAPAQARAQSCTPLDQHWSLTPAWLSQLEAKCLAETGSLCTIGNAVPAESATPANNLKIGFAVAVGWNGHVNWKALTPVACSYPVGTNPAQTGWTMPIGPSETLALTANPTSGPLRKATSFCVGSGNDIVEIAAQSFSCRGVGVWPINYNGFPFSLQGEAGNDRFYGGQGLDILQGGTGDDALYAKGAGDLLYGNDGRDYLDGGIGNDWATGGNSCDIVEDWGTATAGSGTADLLLGGSGNDCIDDQTGAATADGESNTDWCTTRVRANTSTIKNCENRTTMCTLDGPDLGC